MNPVQSNSTNAYLAQQKAVRSSSDSSATKQEQPTQSSTQGQQDKVTLSSESVQLSQQTPKDTEMKEEKGGSVEAFAYGALGMDHPDVVKEQNDPSYTAGQYISAAATIGGLILMLA
ncbi:hypothetical protein [Vibrio agarivorans]|uniref:hypothetical protein n=1 Tax=Vibrio agarivorans TaxID=153622 RepID=UPI00222E4DE9|nr:hypothetical protein [Vibrio agarivorans]